MQKRDEVRFEDVKPGEYVWEVYTGAPPLLGQKLEIEKVSFPYVQPFRVLLPNLPYNPVEPALGRYLRAFPEDIVKFKLGIPIEDIFNAR